jgi:hypothetical protein
VLGVVGLGQLLEALVDVGIGIGGEMVEASARGIERGCSASASRDSVSWRALARVKARSRFSNSALIASRPAGSAVTSLRSPSTAFCASR